MVEPSSKVRPTPAWRGVSTLATWGVKRRGLLACHSALASSIASAIFRLSCNAIDFRKQTGKQTTLIDANLRTCQERTRQKKRWVVLAHHHNFRGRYIPAQKARDL